MPDSSMGSGPKFAGMYFYWQEIPGRPIPDQMKNYIDAKIQRTVEVAFKKQADIEMKKLKVIAQQIVQLEAYINQQGAVLHSYGVLAGRGLWTQYYDSCAKIKILWKQYSLQKIKLYNGYVFDCKIEGKDHITDYEVRVYCGFRGSCQDAINWGI